MSLARLGLLKTSLLDYPGEVAAVLFTHGCNLRCPFCHNPDLVSGPPPEDFIDMEAVEAFLARRKRVLGGVCITGGEPLIHDDIGDLVDMVHAAGLKCKIDTNGTFPEKLSKLAPDFVSLDIKTSPPNYPRLTSPTGDLQHELFSESDNSSRWGRVEESAAWLASSGIEFEFRTTVVPGLVTDEDVDSIIDFIAGLSPGLRYVLAGFRPGKTLDPAFTDLAPYEPEVLESMAQRATKKGITCSTRPNRT